MRIQNWAIGAPIAAATWDAAAAQSRRYRAEPDGGSTAFRNRYRLGCAPGGRHRVYARWGFLGGSAGRSSSDKSVGEESYSGR